MNNTQLSSASSYNVKNLRFSKPEERKIPNSNMNYQLIRIGTVNPDDSFGDLVFETDRLFSYGLQESRSLGGKGELTGYTFPLCLFNRGGPTKGQKDFVDTFDKIVESCKNHLVEYRDDIEKYDLDIHDLKRFNPLYYKRVNGKIVQGRGPMLYAKVIIKRNQDRSINIRSVFQDESTGKDLDPLALLKKYCHTRVILKIESIFIGSKISLQVKLWEAIVKPIDTGRQRFLTHRKVTGTLSSNSLSVDKKSFGETKPSTKPSTTPSTTPSSTSTSIATSSESESEEDKPVVPKPKVVPQKGKRGPRKTKK